MPYVGTIESRAPAVSPVVLPDDFSEHVRAAFEAYGPTLPNGERVWPPFIMNDAPCLPFLGYLQRGGAGKASPEEFVAAANHAYDMIDGPPHSGNTIADEVRHRLADGSLRDDVYNYTGVDCSGLVTNILARSLGACGIDLYGRLLVSPEDVKQAYQTPDWNLDEDREEGLLAQAIATEGLSVRAFIRAVRDHNFPIRGVSGNRLARNSSEVDEDDIRCGDIGVYRPYGVNAVTHVAVVMGAVGRDRIRFAHSGREDVRLEVGGVETFTLSRDAVFKGEYQPGDDGTFTIQRLNFLQTA